MEQKVTMKVLLKSRVRAFYLCALFCSGNDNHTLAREIFYFKPIQTHKYLFAATTLSQFEFTFFN